LRPSDVDLRDHAIQLICRNGHESWRWEWF
jgi:hypothetical protein